MNDLKSKIYGTINRNLIPLSSDLRRSAASAGWPADLVNTMKVELKNNAVTVTYPDELRNQIHDFEYGNERRRPTAVIRRFMNRVDSKLEDR